MLNGIILSFLLAFPIYSSQPIPIEAAIAAGYQVEGFYGVVELTTKAEMLDVQLYRPLNILYDFRFGYKGSGFNLCLSRFCYHNIEGQYAEPWGWRVILEYSNFF
jgi:hypothetical protein